MRKDDEKAAISAFRRHTWAVLGMLILAGITLIAGSVALPARLGLWKELGKELGIVLVAAFGVSILYEILIAERHFHKFFSALREYVDRGESNAAACARLGILEIMPSRDMYEQKYPLRQLLAAAGSGSRIRVVGSTLFLLMTTPEPIQQALEQGARVELCSLDPESPANEIARWNGVVRLSDIQAAMDRFQELCTWVDDAKPPGSLELRHHRIPLIDSFSFFDLGKTQLAVWDLNMGPHVSSKKILVVDATKGLGEDLTKRYDRIWKNAVPRYRYSEGAPSKPVADAESAQR